MVGVIPPSIWDVLTFRPEAQVPKPAAHLSERCSASMSSGAIGPFGEDCELLSMAVSFQSWDRSKASPEIESNPDMAGCEQKKPDSHSFRALCPQKGKRGFGGPRPRSENLCTLLLRRW